jgi:protease-4
LVTKSMIDEGFRWFLSLVETRRKIKSDDIPGLAQGRVFSGQEAVGLKLVDAIGGEDQAVDWLRKTHNIDSKAKVVDWKPESSSGFGFWSSVGSVVEGLFGQSYVGRMLARDPALSTLGLDGLVSVWHPSEN